MIATDTLRRFAPSSRMPDVHARALEAARVGSSVETGGIAHMVENLNYRNAARLDAIFRSVRCIADAKALIARGPEAIANRVYANRLGNGDEASGDGWRYRGSGYKQLTGRANYRDIGRIVGLDLEAHPDLAREPESAARIAFAFWDARGCSSLADAGDVEGVTARINGPAMLGLAERRRATLRAMSIWRWSARDGHDLGAGRPAGAHTCARDMAYDGCP